MVFKSWMLIPFEECVFRYLLNFCRFETHFPQKIISWVLKNLWLNLRSVTFSRPEAMPGFRVGRSGANEHFIILFSTSILFMLCRNVAQTDQAKSVCHMISLYMMGPPNLHTSNATSGTSSCTEHLAQHEVRNPSTRGRP